MTHTIANKLTTAPTVEPVTATDLDTHLRGDGVLLTAEETYLNELLIAAREFIEKETGRAMINQTWTMFLDSFSRLGAEPWWDGVREGAINSLLAAQNFIEIPIAPLGSITTLKTYDGENNSTTFSSSNYFVDTTSTLGRLILNNGQVWPAALRNVMAVEVIYVAGYGAAASAVPGALKQAVLQLAAHWYENREFVSSQSGGTLTVAPKHVQAIIDQWKVMHI